MAMSFSPLSTRRKSIGDLSAGPQIPESLLSCPESPAVPGDNATQADVGRYLLDLYGAVEDCRGIGEPSQNC